MRASNFQTTRLGPGRHNTPADGACVMELASMLAGECFSDHPRSVCPAIAAFLRGYNDTVGDELRQGLYGTAVAVLDTHRGSRVGAQRSELCKSFGELAYRSRRFRLPWAYPVKGRDQGQICLSAGVGAARAALRDEAWHDATLAFTEWLAVSGPGPVLVPEVLSGERVAKRRVAGDELARMLRDLTRDIHPREYTPPAGSSAVCIPPSQTIARR